LLNESKDLYMDLFSKKPKRHLILKHQGVLSQENLDRRNINIWRNTGVEHLISLIQVYLNFFKLEGKFNLSNFDATFSFENRLPADLDLFIIDADQYSVEKLKELINLKFEELLNIGSKIFTFYLISSVRDIEIANMISEIKSRNLGIDILTINEIEEISAIQKQNTRLSNLTASWLTSDASNLVARDVAIRSIATKYKPILKLVVFDLDNTLYRGILSEDGLNHLKRTKADLKLGELILNMRNQNLLTGLITKNNKNEVLELFEKRKDFGFNLQSFDFFYVDWEPKSTHMQSILRASNLGASSVLYVDDNFMELELMSQGNPGINLVPGGLDEITIQLVESHLNFRSKISSTTRIERVDDIRASQERTDLLKKLDFDKAQKNLETRITVSKILQEDLPRISELSLKTNQFNFNFSRLQLPNLIDEYSKNRIGIIKIDLKDKFIDSGLVGFMSFDLGSPSELIINEICISCRAIGRGLESQMIYTGLKLALQEKKIEMGKIKIKYKEGPRNNQVIEWVKKENLKFDGDCFNVSVTSVVNFSPKEFVDVKSD
jgi:FkbH-like protein